MVASAARGEVPSTRLPSGAWRGLDLDPGIRAPVRGAAGDAGPIATTTSYARK
jgi:hypothetical protein